MGADKAAFRVPPIRDQLFPHREFPPFIALESVNRRLQDVVHRARDNPLDLDRLQAILIDVAERLVEVAQGNLSLSRWYRRLAVSMRLCHEAKQVIVAYARVEILTAAEAQALSDGVRAIIDELNDTIARADLPDEVREVIPPLSSPGEPR
jgi:hypothetical protein